MPAPRKGETAFKIRIIALVFVILSCSFSGCKESSESEPVPQRTRAEAIPADAVKGTPETDVFPPVLHSEEWENPVPMPGPVNTAGAEDAPVMARDGNTFFFFFTPDVRVPANEQLLDGVTGIWWSKRTDSTWSEPERIVLNDDIGLDGPMCIVGDTLWFASMRVGNYLDDGDLYTAVYAGSRWQDWRNAGEQLNSLYNVGENYLTGDAWTMYFGRTGFGGFGGYDLWKTERTDSGWSEPDNLGPPVNTALDGSHPWVSADGSELWFTSTSRLGYTGPALFRTVMGDSGWSDPMEIVSNFAGDPGLDDAGNLYFTHHFYSAEIVMLEADVYVAYKR